MAEGCERNLLKSMEITHTSQYAFDFLNRHRRGAVHSVYKKTINLEMDGQLLAIQVSGSPLSPLSLITDQTAESLDTLKLQPGDPVLATAWSRKLLVGTHCFHWDKPAVVDLQLKGPDPRFTPNQTSVNDRQTSQNHGSNPVRSTQCCDPELSGTILELLKTYPPVGFVPLFVDVPASPAGTHAAPDPFLTQTETILRTGAPITDLIGLGIGLTPSGDDFLCGVLAGLTLLGLRDSQDFRHLSAEISRNLAKTNAISAAFLRCAMDGQFSEALVTLGSVSFVQSLQMFHDIGHSSGADTLCGLYFALCGLYFAFGKFS